MFLKTSFLNFLNLNFCLCIKAWSVFEHFITSHCLLPPLSRRFQGFIPSIPNSDQIYVTNANLIEILFRWFFNFDLIFLSILVGFLFKINIFLGFALYFQLSAWWFYLFLLLNLQLICMLITQNTLQERFRAQKFSKRLTCEKFGKLIFLKTLFLNFLNLNFCLCFKAWSLFVHFITLHCLLPPWSRLFQGFIPSIPNSDQLNVTNANLIEILFRWFFNFDLIFFSILVRFLFRIKCRLIFHLVITFRDRCLWYLFDF